MRVGVIMWPRRDVGKGSWPFGIQASAAPTADKSLVLQAIHCVCERASASVVLATAPPPHKEKTNGKQHGSVHPAAAGGTLDQAYLSWADLWRSPSWLARVAPGVIGRTGYGLS